jgi:hypothetical protein
VPSSLLLHQCVQMRPAADLATGASGGKEGTGKGGEWQAAGGKKVYIQEMAPREGRLAGCRGVAGV